MLESVRAPDLRRLGACLVDDRSPSPHVREMLDAGAARGPADPASSTRAENGGIVAASNDAAGDGRAASSSPCSTTTTSSIPTPWRSSHEALLARPRRPTTSTPTKTRSTREGHHAGPFFKPDWSPERMRTQMYTCHLSVLRRSLVEEVGGFDPEFEGSQDWDLVLQGDRAGAGRAPRAARPLPLADARRPPPRVAARRRSRGPSKRATRAIQAHCERIGVAGRGRARRRATPASTTCEPALRRGAAGQHRHPDRRAAARDPLPGGGRWSSTASAASSSARPMRTTRSSSSPTRTSTPAALARAARASAGERLRLVHFDRPFNFSAKINRGAVHARGEHLLLLNDDMEVVTPDWIERMVMYSRSPEVGAVGGRLLLEDGRIQHAGIGFENGGLPGPPLLRLPRRLAGYAQQRPRSPATASPSPAPA